MDKWTLLMLHVHVERAKRKSSRDLVTSKQMQVLNTVAKACGLLDVGLNLLLTVHNQRSSTRNNLRLCLANVFGVILRELFPNDAMND